jgi:UDP-glucuronate 4-epimerase
MLLQVLYTDQTLKMPFSVQDTVDHPVSLYAASKKANELMAHTYSHLFNIPSTGLRFFTVYGPWGRPDMAIFLFTKAIIEGKPIAVFNNGEMIRDFTYVDDIVKGVISAVNNPAKPNENWNGDFPDAASSTAPYRLYNIGNSSPVKLIDFITALEQVLGITAKKDFLPIQPGDVKATWADIEDISKELDFHPDTPLIEGIGNFVSWYKNFYKL